VAVLVLHSHRGVNGPKVDLQLERTGGPATGADRFRAAFCVLVGAPSVNYAVDPTFGPASKPLKSEESR